VRKELIATAALLVCGQSFASEPPRVDVKYVYTLYRSSAVVGGKTWRLHVATFDAVEGAEYNRGNCEIAKRLFQAQPGITVEYWCERGYFSKK
jgi:hypothetical protein